MLAPLALHPVDDKLRVLDLQVTTPSGEVYTLELPWDRTAFDLEPVLVAGTPHDLPDRTVLAHPKDSVHVDVLETPLGKVLRHAENPEGALALVIHVETSTGLLEFTVTCSDIGEPEPHQAYPRAKGSQIAQRLGAYLATEEPEWFCDGSSTLSCCAAHREAPQGLDWVAV